MPSAFPALGRLRQKDHEFEATLSYTVKPCLKKIFINTRTFYIINEKSKMQNNISRMILFL
jgi:hypothetical protein